MTTPTATHPQAADPAIPIRRMDFTSSVQHIPKYFAKNGEILLSYYFALMSAAFPAGEDFFVRSVRHFRDQVTDPQLRDQVRSFLGQETIHARQHEGLNVRLAELGYPVDLVTRVGRKVVAFRSRSMSPESCLAQTAAAEHVTATLAEIFLSDPEARNCLADETVLGILMWHALEEAEHKAVAFDVYRSIGGSERRRIKTAKVMRTTAIINPILALTLALIFEPAIRRPSVLLRNVRSFRASPISGKNVMDRLKLYERTGFHPNDIDTTHLLEEWRERLFGADGSLNDVLAAKQAS